MDIFFIYILYFLNIKLYKYSGLASFVLILEANTF